MQYSGNKQGCKACRHLFLELKISPSPCADVHGSSNPTFQFPARAWRKPCNLRRLAFISCTCSQPRLASKVLQKLQLAISSLFLFWSFACFKARSFISLGNLVARKPLHFPFPFALPARHKSLDASPFAVGGCRMVNFVVVLLLLSDWNCVRRLQPESEI